MSKEIEEAKQLLLEAGFRVSEAPIEWREISAVVTIKVQSPDFNESKFIKDLEDVILPLFSSRSQICSRINADIRQYSGPTIKRFSRVKGATS